MVEEQEIDSARGRGSRALVQAELLLQRCGDRRREGDVACDVTGRIRRRNRRRRRRKRPERAEPQQPPRRRAVRPVVLRRLGEGAVREIELQLYVVVC